MPERIVNHGETVVQALSFASSILLVLVHEHYECRGCLVLAEDCTRSQRLPGPRAALDHLDEHLKRGDSGARDAIWKMEACDPCRGAGRHFPPFATPILCSTCGGSGKNDQGKERGVRRGVVVG